MTGKGIVFREKREKKLSMSFISVSRTVKASLVFGQTRETQKTTYNSLYLQVTLRIKHDIPNPFKQRVRKPAVGLQGIQMLGILGNFFWGELTGSISGERPFISRKL